jgi:transporter family-2 protein
MPPVLLYIVVGIISGAVIGFQGPLASIITHRLGLLESVFIIHLGGTLVALIPLLVFRDGGKLGEWRTLPWYVFLAGVCGLVVFAGISFLIPKIGVTPAMMLIIVGQIIIGSFLDHHGMLGAEVRLFSFTKLAGIGVMLLGAWLTFAK